MNRLITHRRTDADGFTRFYYSRGGSKWLVREQGQYWPVSEAINKAINESRQRARDPFYDPARNTR